METNFTFAQMNLIKGLRKFWEQQVLWMRSFIISNIEELDDLPYVTQRLFRNSEDFIYLLEVFFGREQAERFASFITVHMSRIMYLIDALKNNDQASVDRLTQELNRNADEMAGFFALMNPFWMEEQWRMYLYNLVSLTVNQIVARLADNYQEDIRIFDQIEENVYAMSDYMAQGIMYSFNV
jgi:hypothetical protein